MALLLLLTLLASVALGSAEVQCEGKNCKPRPATLLPATSVIPPTPASLEPASTPLPTTHTPTPANHTTPTPANHTTPTPANHTTPTPANHTTPIPSNHTTLTNHTTLIPTNHTTPIPTNHTTPIPTHHTTHLIPPTVVPPVLRKGTYKVTDKKVVCALATMKIELRVHYKGYKQEKWGTFFIQPNKTRASGKCGDDSVNMTLTFPQGFLTFRFLKNTKDKTYHLQQIQTQLTYQFPGATAPTKFVAHNSALLVMHTRLGHCYQCSNQTLEASNSFWVDLVDQQLQVFEIPKTQTFGPADICPSDHKVPVVAIVVVVLLVVLILIIVIAYLISRKRSPAGYQSI
ncbi:macrosialin-like [Pristis pectinata]|uniref:macrosialin-like n=1 Tax=Pristis pectinata TaxID=685728 RepID=UPI00223DEA01|nr:macrosialin-like [Pristis pectinata]